MGDSDKSYSKVGSSSRPRMFINYPQPLKGPTTPYNPERKSNPPIRGASIVYAATIMEWSRFVREAVYKNAGFTSLRNLKDYIEEFEPWFEPQVIPVPTNEPKEDYSGEPVVLPKEPADHRAKYPAARYYSAADYRELYLSGDLTPTQVAKALLPLIRRDVAPAGEHSLAFIDTNAVLVLEAAEASTRRYGEGRSLGLLDGVPTAVKDEYDMDGYATTLGSSRDYKGTKAEDNDYTTWCVKRLNAAGALILGKLSMHEFGLDTTGNNPVHGTPMNPHNPLYYPGGSSSGTAYAVSAGLIPVGLGSDGGGSIRIPAAVCGVYGLKPTHGRVSLLPGQNHSVTCAVNGPIAADMQSLATMFSVMAEPHPASSFPSLGRLHLTPPKDKILGIPEAWFARATPGTQQLCRDMIDRLVSERGYTTVPVDIPFLLEGQTAHALTVLCDAATLLPLTKGVSAANRIMVALGKAAPASDLMLAQKLRRVLMQHLAWLWQEYPGMMIVTPVMSCDGWPLRSKSELKYGVSDGDRTVQMMEYTWLANFCGVPAITVPAGFVAPQNGAPDAGEVAGMETKGKIPIGLMATAEWCQEEQLLQFGYEVEQISGDKRSRPPNWVDVVDEARKMQI